MGFLSLSEEAIAASSGTSPVNDDPFLQPSLSTSRRPPPPSFSSFSSFSPSSSSSSSTFLPSSFASTSGSDRGVAAMSNQSFGGSDNNSIINITSSISGGTLQTELPSLLLPTRQHQLIGQSTGRTRAPTSFSLYLPDLLTKLKSARDGLEEVDDKLQEYMMKIPEAVAQVKDNYATKTTDVGKTLKETLETSRLVRDKVRSFNNRVDDALKDALKFNQLVKEQHEVPTNKLPEEMFEGAGAVVAQLSRSHNLGHQLLMKDSERLVRLAKQTKLRYASFSPQALQSLALLTPPDGSRSSNNNTTCSACDYYSTPQPDDDDDENDENEEDVIQNKRCSAECLRPTTSPARGMRRAAHSSFL